MSINNRLHLVAKGQLKVWFTCAVIAGCVFLWLPSIEASIVSTDDSVRRTLGGLVAQLAGTTAGFLITALALVFALPDRPILSAMKASGHYLDLCASIISGTLGCIVVTLFAAILSATDNTVFWLRLLVSCILPVAYLLFLASVRLILTLIAVGRPD